MGECEMRTTGVTLRSNATSVHGVCFIGFAAMNVLAGFAAVFSTDDFVLGVMLGVWASLAVAAYLARPDALSRLLALWAVIALAWITLVPTPARAQNAPTYRSAYVPMFDRDDDWRHARHRPHRHYKVWRHHDVEGDRCKARLAIVGDQYASEKGAREEADKAWMQTARWQHGERYMARDHARDAAYECGRSSVGSVVGQIFYRCRLTARPCRAPSRGDE